MASGGDIYAFMLMLRARSEGFTLEQIQAALAAMWNAWGEEGAVDA